MAAEKDPMTSLPADSVFPERLQIRDTGLHDDTGGGGQRIYTTAGRGYETCLYIRADATPFPGGVPVQSARMQCYHEGCQFMALTEQNRLLRERLERTATRAAELQRELAKVMEHLQEFQRR